MRFLNKQRILLTVFYVIFYMGGNDPVFTVYDEPSYQEPCYKQEANGQYNKVCHYFVHWS